MDFIIDHLANHVDAIPTLARWHHDQWAHMAPPGRTLDDRVTEFRRRATRGRVPTGFVALMNDDVVGMACLIESDLDSHDHLTPWLAGVLTSPSHRRQGIASALCRRVDEEARALGFTRAYLFTLDKQNLYGRLGWTTMEHSHWRGHAITIMTIDLGSQSA
jgi:predicted N-acetyltransferase YhbS